MDNIAARGCPLLVKSFIACGEVTLDVDGGEKTVEVQGVRGGDLILATIKTNDTGTSITHLEAVAGSNQITLTRNDDVSSADNGVVQYFVIRPQ